MKTNETIKTTNDSRTYKLLTTIDLYFQDMCPICPMYDHCKQRKHIKCKPDRIRERNWKSQRKNQYK